MLNKEFSTIPRFLAKMIAEGMFAAKRNMLVGEWRKAFELVDSKIGNEEAFEERAKQ